jgi:hypothetical protein
MPALTSIPTTVTIPATQGYSVVSRNQSPTYAFDVNVAGRDEEGDNFWRATQGELETSYALFWTDNGD